MVKYRPVHEGLTVSGYDVIRVKQSSDAGRRSPEGERRSPSEDETEEKNSSSAEIHNAEDYKEIFQPKNAICRSTPAATPATPATRPTFNLRQSEGLV